VIQDAARISVRGITATRQPIRQLLGTGAAKLGNFMHNMKMGGDGPSKQAKDPAALASYLGSKKTGKSKSQSLASKGRRRRAAGDKSSSYA